ncbi:MAG: hypothetical protein ABIP74_03685 [Candidatus Saccharimonas sp.]
MAKTEKRAIDKVFVSLGVVATVALLIVGALAWYGYSFATDMVKTQLSAQRVFFPAKDSPSLVALPEADRAEMNKYAGQQLTTGEQARVYADHFIGVHLSEVAGGKTYSEVSAESMKDPTNQTLQTQKAVLFQGETLRGLLLGSGYAFWTFGMIAMYAAVASFIGAAVMGLLVLLGLRHLAKLK